MVYPNLEITLSNNHAFSHPDIKIKIPWRI